ncbi:hypothetical protein AVEN_135455-1 [Araneus ventricosus]|uniref:Uncharacterized protein n=1 Tax=Araneus ventricosus TaxID=182803 RepID=A0A4Y2BEB8_ARAVE|nr:hypothetical protein AVEN_135455-1 [Araneus ventricosus]
MSDLLGSILSSMEKPPSVNSERNKLLQKQKKILEKQQAAQKAKLTSFREKIGALRLRLYNSATTSFVFFNGYQGF